MTRPAVSVVMPFAGSPADADAAVSSLLALAVRDGDELILADNSATAPPDSSGVIVVPAPAERSPAHARNAGAERARGEWILFLDADCRPSPRLLDAYFASPVAPEVGALAGGVVAAAGGAGLAARYAAAQNFLNAEAHLAHPYRPRAVAANLLVRRAAFEELGGFYEGLRAAEDTDFCWRLQEAGWRLELRSHASVEHRYRATLAGLRRQWRGYAAGRAWLARRNDGFTPEPALVRAARRVARGVSRATAGPTPTGASRAGAASRATAGPRAFLALDVLLALDELVGFALSNRPQHESSRRRRVDLVLVADRFPARGDPALDETLGVPHARVEAVARPGVVDSRAARAIAVDYREDDGLAARAAALVRLLAAHPARGARHALMRLRRPGAPRLCALAPAALRLERDRGARVRALGNADATARRLAALAGAALERESP